MSVFLEAEQEKTAVIFVHLLEWNSVFIQIPFGSSLISNIFLFIMQRCL